MSYSVKTYVVIPKNYNFENHISLLESTGINVDIETARKILQDSTDGGCHIQDYGFLNDDDIEEGFDFVLRVLKDLGMILFEYNTGQPYNASISNIRDHLMAKKEIVLRLLTE